MVAPRLEVNLDKIHHNAQELIKRLAERDISIAGVTKASLGSIEIADTLIRAGVAELADSRIENIKVMYASAKDGLTKSVPMILIRSPMLSQIEQVVMYADISCNTEIKVIERLSAEAIRQKSIHEILLMIELGDLREGIMPDELVNFAKEVLTMPNIRLKGIGTNLACRSGVTPSNANMTVLSNLANKIEATLGVKLDIVSGGNSANIEWALGNDKTDFGRINHLRLGESILLGCEALERKPIKGLYTDAFTLFAEVIESKLKPTQAKGAIAQAAFGNVVPVLDHGIVQQIILALGVHDIDPSGLTASKGSLIVGSSSDHLILEQLEGNPVIGDEIEFQLDYGALLRAMTSPYVEKIFLRQLIQPSLHY